MKRKIFSLISILAAGFLIAGCGGAGSSSSSPTGTATMRVTDAKPVLPVRGVESVSITFDEVSVHRSGGTWVRLATAQQPYFTADLYEFSDGATTQIVPPVRLDAGRYTQVRIGVISGTIKINGVDHPLEIPSDNLKIDKNFQFDVAEGGAVDLTVDFDLSQSIVLTGSGTYQLKPVLHLVSTADAWTIRGNLSPSSSDTQEAVVVVYHDSNDSGAFEGASDQEYTRLKLSTSKSHGTQFDVFWLVPNESYYVEVYLGEPGDPPALKYSEFVNKSPEWPSKAFPLNGGSAINLVD